MAKLYNEAGKIVGNFACIHFYEHGWGSDLTKEIRPHQQQLIQIFKENQQRYLAECSKCSEWGTVVGLYDGPFHDGKAKLLASGVSVVSLDDCHRFDKKKGLLIAINRAAFLINKRVVRKTVDYGLSVKETRYIIVDR